MGSYVIDLVNLYQQVFGKRAVVAVPQQSNAPGQPYSGIPSKTTVTLSAVTGSVIRETYNGEDVWLPITFLKLPTSLFPTGKWYIPYATSMIEGETDWIEADLKERVGSAKFLFSTKDYKIVIRGFFIDKANRVFPDQDLNNLKKLHESGQSFQIDTATTNAFLNSTDRVVIRRFQIMPTEGGKIAFKAFSMELASDSIFTLEKS